ncbi:hypothetical protein [Hyphococcus luteus]|uniref:Sulfotransferase family protein n=1 Tax=Hyphococcus luteus TaxID=2058213 RepID=A0A2S7K7R2_9PROT|nr:hypothetical protein [Marinicaulis flavus]PQA88545.1 hypothetical protein CW354_09695 [Marinicaulis flavus]
MTERAAPLSEPTCILHIGVHKTGSSSWQVLTVEQRDLLAEQYGIYCSSKWPNYTPPLRSLFQSHPEKYLGNIIRGANTPELAKKQNESYLADLWQDLEAAQGMHFMISAEGLSALRADEVKKFKELLNRQYSKYLVIAYLRHPLDWASSGAQQSLTGGKTLQDIHNAPPLVSYEKRIAPWLETFGHDALILRDFGLAAKERGSIVGDICRLLNIDEEIYAFQQKKSNESMSYVAAALLSKLNEVRPYMKEGAVAPNRSINDYSTFKKIKGSRFSLPDDLKETMQEAISTDLAWLKNEFNFEFAPVAPREDPPLALEPKTIESLALLVSDLTNESQAHLVRALHAEALVEAKDNPDLALKKLRHALRLNPYNEELQSALKSIKEKTG